jgi:hypothetical protein
MAELFFLEMKTTKENEFHVKFTPFMGMAHHLINMPTVKYLSQINVAKKTF